jgi:Ca-activated chloride channel family protein
MMETLLQLISEFTQANLSGSIADLHFIRPLWLLLLLPAAALPFIFTIKDRQSSDWEQAISATLLPFLQAATPAKKTQYASGIASIILITLSLSLAGPSWSKSEQPVQKLKDDLVIVLDLSLSMYATDLSPNRITRVRQKIQDILDNRREGDTGLIVYSADAHVVVPLTDDMRTIQAMLPALDPFIMPAAGSEPAAGIKLANELLKQSGSANGRVLLITDGIEDFQISEVTSALSDRSLQILSVGTRAGAPIDLPERGYLKDGDTVIVAGNNFDTLKQLAKDTGAKIQAMTLTDADLKSLDLTPDRTNTSASETSEQSLTSASWQDRGYLLTLPLILLALIFYRRGIMMIALIPLLTMTPIDKTEAAAWDDLWTTKDQQAANALENGDAETAAKLFENEEWKAYAKQKANQSLDAAKIFSDVSGKKWSDKDKAEAYYNAGTSYAKGQEFEASLEALNKALELNPEHEAAITNKQIVEKILQQQKEEQQKQEQSKDDKESSENGEDKQEGESGDSQKNNGDGQDNSEGGQGDQNNDNNENGNNQSEQDKKDSDAQDGSDKSTQSSEQNNEATNQPPAEANKGPEGEQPEQQSSTGVNEEDKPTDPGDTPAEGAMAQGSAEPLNNEEQQAFEQWMRRVPDDPSGLLRRKFAQQYQQGDNNKKPPGRPLW